MNLRSLWKQYKVVILPVAILAGCVVGILAALLPLGRSALSMFEEVKTLRAETQVLADKVSVLTNLDRDTLETNLAVVSGALPTDKSVPGLLTAAEAISGRAGVTLTDLTLASPGTLATETAKFISSEEKRLGANILQFTATIEGGLEQIRNFLAESGSVRRLVRVERFGIGKTTSGAISAQVEMVTYYAPLLFATGKILDPLMLPNPAEETLLSRVADMPLVSIGSVQPAAVFGPAVKPDPFAP